MKIETVIRKPSRKIVYLTDIHKTDSIGRIKDVAMRHAGETKSSVFDASASVYFDEADSMLLAVVTLYTD